MAHQWRRARNSRITRGDFPTMEDRWMEALSDRQRQHTDEVSHCERVLLVVAAAVLIAGLCAGTAVSYVLVSTKYTSTS